MVFAPEYHHKSTTTKQPRTTNNEQPTTTGVTDAQARVKHQLTVIRAEIAIRPSNLSSSLCKIAAMEKKR